MSTMRGGLAGLRLQRARARTNDSQTNDATTAGLPRTLLGRAVSSGRDVRKLQRGLLGARVRDSLRTQLREWVQQDRRHVSTMHGGLAGQRLQRSCARNYDSRTSDATAASVLQLCWRVRARRLVFNLR